MRRHSDFDGDGRHGIPVASPWGMGLLDVDGSALVTRVIAPNGTRFSGGWLLNTADNRFDAVADLDGDGRAELLVASPWGVGVLEQSGAHVRTRYLARNGTRFGGWLLNTVDNRLGPTGDFDGDGRDEVFVTSPWGVGIWRLGGGGFDAVTMAANGTAIGAWVVDTAETRFVGIGDVNGDGRAEILAQGPSGVAILTLSGASLGVVASGANGTRFGEWLVNTRDNTFHPLGDVDGDGRAEILASSPWGLGVLEMSGSTLTSRHMVRNGTRIGGWLVNSLDNRYLLAGDYDGDGRDEVLIASPWGVGICEESAGSLRMSMMASNGTWFGGWRLNTSDNRFGPVADFDGDGRDEVVVASPWGMAILDVNGASVGTRVIAANGTRFSGGWLLNTADNRIGVGPEVVRLHLKILQDPVIAIQDMVEEMTRVYAQAGIDVQVASTQRLNLGAAMLDVDVGSCTAGNTTDEQDRLFANRDNAPTTDVAVYFVRSTVPAYNGCAAHPNGLPAAVVARGASLWTLGHEVGHVLGLPHVTSTDRLMTGGGTANITNPPPDISEGEANTARASLLTHPI